MKFLYGLGGANVPVIREYELLYAGDNYKCGQIVKGDENGKVTLGAGYKTLGVVAEDHSGEKDILNSRADGNKIRVNITKDGVYRADALRIVVSGTGTSTTVLTKAEDLSSALVNSLIVLVEKGEGSQNTDEIGTSRKIGAYNLSAGVSTITVANGGISYEGDVYAVIPPIGSEHNISEDYKTVGFGLGGGGALKVVGNDIEKCTIDVILKETIFD